jgi:hypothetical protein
MAVVIAALFYLPNLWWNWSHGFATYVHTRNNAELGGTLFHPLAFAEFVASQIGVFGPIFFAGLVAVFIAPTRRAGPPARLLLAFTVPTLALITALSLMSRAQPNWAAAAYISAIVAVVAAALSTGWRRALIFSIALHIAFVVAVFGGSEIIAAGLPVSSKLDPLHRLRGWRELGAQVSRELAAHPGVRLMADDREILAALVYYVHPHPLDAVAWDPIPGISNQWDLENNLSRHRGESFLAVTIHHLAAQMRPDFAELTELQTIDTPTGPGGGQSYTLYLARDYRGEPAAR